MARRKRKIPPGCTIMYQVQRTDPYSGRTRYFFAYQSRKIANEVRREVSHKGMPATIRPIVVCKGKEIKM